MDRGILDSRGMVSVVIPVYNAELYVFRSVKSVLEQTYPNMQVVLVNDGSIDDSDAVCRKIVEEYDNVIYSKHETNMGQTITRNDGIELATGDWLLFLDSDDELEISAVNELLGLTNDEVDIVFAGYKMTHSGSQVSFLADIDEGIFSRDEFVYHLFDDVPPHVLSCIGSKLYRMDYLKERKEKTDESITTNYDMAFVIDALLNCRSVAYLNKPVYNYIQREGSITYSYRNEMFSRICEARRNIPLLFEKAHCFEKKQLLFQEMQLDLVSSALYQEVFFKKGFERFKITFDKIFLSSEFDNISKTIENSKRLKKKVFARQIKKKNYLILYIWLYIKKIYRIARGRML